MSIPCLYRGRKVSNEVFRKWLVIWGAGYPADGTQRCPHFLWANIQHFLMLRPCEIGNQESKSDFCKSWPAFWSSAYLLILLPFCVEFDELKGVIVSLLWKHMYGNAHPKIPLLNLLWVFQKILHWDFNLKGGLVLESSAISVLPKACNNRGGWA